MKTGSIRAKLQAFGGFLTAMVIPNMGAFIGWGLITALFISDGWIPNEEFSRLVSPILTYLLPLLLAYSGGNLVYGQRGGVAGVFVTMGLIVGSDIAMFLGAMIMGPLSAWVIKKFDKLIEDKVPTGFEMVINNFSLGIIGCILCLCSYTLIGPLIAQANNLVSSLIQALVKTGFLPILSLINEPAKVLFLNNVIDQGIYYPLGMQQALEMGKSIYFMVASNPGAGLGLLLAYALFSKGSTQKSASGAIIIHFLGGIHEIYFPFVLMKPVMIIAMILGNGTGTFVFNLLHTGLVAGPSPGSIFSYVMLTPKGDYLGMFLGVAAAAVVSFLVASAILKFSKDTSDEELEASVERSKNMKQEGKDLLNQAVSQEKQEAVTEKAAKEKIADKAETVKIDNVAFACDAGLGSSAMGASAFRKRLQKEQIDITVKNYAIEKVPQEAQVAVIHENLLERARMCMPDKRIITIKNYLGDPAIDELFREITEQYKK